MRNSCFVLCVLVLCHAALSDAEPANQECRWTEDDVGPNCGDAHLSQQASSDVKKDDRSHTGRAHETTDSTPQQYDLDHIHSLLSNAKAAVATLSNAIAEFESRLNSMHGQDLQSSKGNDVISSQRRKPTEAPLLAHSPTDQPAVTADRAFDSATGSALSSFQGWQRVVAKGRKPWSSYFSLLAAVKTDEEVTAIHAVHENSFSGQHRYMALGDRSGKLYFFSSQGEVLLEASTGTRSAVTAITSYPSTSFPTTLVTGHEDGDVRHHALHETFNRDFGTYAIVNLTLQAVTPHPYNTTDFGGQRVGPPSIVLLDLHQTSAARSTVVVDSWGGHRWVLPFGDVRFTQHTNATILAARKGRTLTAMAVNDGIWINVAPPYEHVLRKLDCVPLNGTTFLAAAFDAVRPYLLYAITSDGQLLSLLAPTDNRADNCSIWTSRPLGLPPGKFQLHTIKSYLLLFHQQGVAVFNVTQPGRVAPIDVILEPVSNIAMAFGRSVSSVDAPLVGGSKVGYIALHFGGGLVGIFSSTLPVYHPPDLKMDVWTKPLFVVVMIGVAVWQFNRSSSAPRSGFGNKGTFGRGRSGEGDPRLLEALLRSAQEHEGRSSGPRSRGRQVSFEDEYED